MHRKFLYGWKAINNKFSPCFFPILPRLFLCYVCICRRCHYFFFLCVLVFLTSSATFKKLKINYLYVLIFVEMVFFEIFLTQLLAFVTSVLSAMLSYISSRNIFIVGEICKLFLNHLFKNTYMRSETRFCLNYIRLIQIVFFFPVFILFYF